MKKAILLIITLFTISIAQAQSPRIGVKIGTGLTSVHTMPKTDYTYKLKLQGGIMLNFALSQLLQFQPEVLYSQKGYEYKTGSATFNDKTSYIDVPLLARITISPLYFEAGPQVSFLLSSKMITGSKETDYANKTKSTVFGLTGGVGYMTNNLNYGFRISKDITNSYVIPAKSTNKAQNIGFNIYVGFFL